MCNELTNYNKKLLNIELRNVKRLICSLFSFPTLIFKKIFLYLANVLNPCDVLGYVLGTEGKTVNKQMNSLPSWSLCPNGGEEQ